jgi:hypothetical protein
MKQNGGVGSQIPRAILENSWDCPMPTEAHPAEAGADDKEVLA